MKNTWFVLLVVFTSVLVNSPPLAAQDPPDSIFRVQGVVVRTAAVASIIGGASAVTVELDSVGTAPAATLADVLRTMPFVQVRTNSRGEARLTLRGSSERQVSILVDGVPVSIGWDHRADVSLVPLTAARRVVLVRGLSSLLGGPNSLGGVVKVSMVPDTSSIGRQFIMGGFSADHMGNAALSTVASASIPFGFSNLALRAGAGYTNKAGVALPGQLDRAGAGEDGLLLNSDSERADGYLGLHYQGWTGRWASISASANQGRRGVVPELHLASPRFWRYPELSRYLLALSAGTGRNRTPLGHGSLEFGLGLQGGSTLLHSYGSDAYDDLSGAEEARDGTVTLRLAGDHELGGAARLRAAATLAGVGHSEGEPNGPSDSYRQRLWSVASEIIWSGSSGLARQHGLQASGGLVVDGASSLESGPQPLAGSVAALGGRAGLSALLGTGHARIHASVSRRARFPSLRETYSGALGKFVPNPDLGPELQHAFEGGLTADAGGFDVQAVVFHQRLADAIVRVGLGGGQFQRINRDGVNASGLELLGGFQRQHRSIRADLVLQQVGFTGSAEGERVEYEPALAGSIDVGSPLFAGIDAAASIGFTGRQWCAHPEQGGYAELAAAAHASAAFSRDWQLGSRLPGALGSRAGLRVGMDNITDAAVYEQCGLPRPGRTLSVEIRIR